MYIYTYIYIYIYTYIWEHLNIYVYTYIFEKVIHVQCKCQRTCRSHFASSFQGVSVCVFVFSCRLCKCGCVCACVCSCRWPELVQVSASMPVCRQVMRQKQLQVMRPVHPQVMSQQQLQVMRQQQPMMRVGTVMTQRGGVLTVVETSVAWVSCSGQLASGQTSHNGANSQVNVNTGTCQMGRPNLSGC